MILNSSRKDKNVYSVMNTPCCTTGTVANNGFSDDSDDDTKSRSTTTTPCQVVMNGSPVAAVIRKIPNITCSSKKSNDFTNESKHFAILRKETTTTPSLKHADNNSGGRNTTHLLRYQNLKRRKLHLHSSSTTTNNINHYSDNHHTKSKTAPSAADNKLEERICNNLQFDNSKNNDKDSSKTKSEPKQNNWSLQYCSVILPIITIIFFFVLGLIYVAMKANYSMGPMELVMHLQVCFFIELFIRVWSVFDFKNNRKSLIFYIFVPIEPRSKILVYLGAPHILLSNCIIL